MKALNTALVILVVLLVLAAVWRLAGGKLPGRRDGFGNAHAVTVSWSPPANYPFPQNLVYNWAFCMAPPCAAQSGIGLCPDPPGDPSSWQYHGTVSAPSLALNYTNCPTCVVGCKATLMLQAVDTQTKAVGPWVAAAVDLSSPAPKSVAITDASGQPLAQGSTGFVYTLALDPSAFAAGSKTFVFGTVTRLDGSEYSFASELPFSSVAGGVGTFSGSLTAPAAWSGGRVPGPLQNGDHLEVQAAVYSTGKDGPIYYWGLFTAAASTATPGSPAQIFWTVA